MPTLRDIPINLKTTDVVRRIQTDGNSKASSMVASLVDELLLAVRLQSLIRPAVCFETYPVTEIRRTGISLDNGRTLDGEAFSRFLASAKQITILFGTIGIDTEKRVKEYFSQDDPLRAYVLDEIGSASVELLSTEAYGVIAREAASCGLHAGSFIRPGESCLPLSQQQRLFEMASPTKIGITLTTAGLMIPRKSTSMIIGIGTKMKTWTKAEACSRCNLSRTCHYRVRSNHNEQRWEEERSENQTVRRQ